MKIVGGDELLRLAEGLLQNWKPFAESFREFIDENDPNSLDTAVALFRKLKLAIEIEGTMRSICAMAHLEPLQRLQHRANQTPTDRLW